jgi:hypothetical protein
MTAESSVRSFDILKLRKGIDKCIRFITTDTHTLSHSINAYTSVELKKILTTLEYPRDEWPQTNKPLSFLFECTTEHFMDAVRNLTTIYNQDQLEDLCRAVWETNKGEIESFVDEFGEAETDEDDGDTDDGDDTPESTYMLVDQMSEIISILSKRKTMLFLEDDGDEPETFEFGGIKDGYSLEWLIKEAKCLIAWSK